MRWHKIRSTSNWDDVWKLNWDHSVKFIWQSRYSVLEVLNQCSTGWKVEKSNDNEQWHILKVVQATIMKKWNIFFVCIRWYCMYYVYHMKRKKSCSAFLCPFCAYISECLDDGHTQSMVIFWTIHFSTILIYVLNLIIQNRFIVVKLPVDSCHFSWAQLPGVLCSPLIGGNSSSEKIFIEKFRT